MEIKNIDNNNILVLSREEFVGLFSKGYPLFNDYFLNYQFTRVYNGDYIYNSFIYNQFYEVCRYRGFVFEGKDREKVIGILKNGTDINFDDYLLIY
jgi:hypothetical protein